MENKKPEDWLNRSPRFGQRADKYSGRIDKELAQSSRANRGGTDLSWERTTTQFDELMQQPRSIIITFAVLALGIFMMVMAFAGGGGRMFALGLFVTAFAGFPSYYIVSSMRYAREIGIRLLEHNLDIDRNQEAAVNLIRSQFTQAELQIAALEANVSTAEIQGALISAAAVAFAQAEERKASNEYSADVRRQDHELKLLDKQVLLEEAKGRVRVDELNAQAEASRAEIKLHSELDFRRSQQQVLIAREEFNRTMTELDKKNNHEARMQRNNALTQFGKVIIATNEKIQNDPSLREKLDGFMKEFNFINEALRKSEPTSIEEAQQKQLLDQLITRMWLNEHGMGDSQASA